MRTVRPPRDPALGLPTKAAQVRRAAPEDCVNAVGVDRTPPRRHCWHGSRARRPPSPPASCAGATRTAPSATGSSCARWRAMVPRPGNRRSASCASATPTTRWMRVVLSRHDAHAVLRKNASREANCCPSKFLFCQLPFSERSPQALLSLPCLCRQASFERQAKWLAHWTSVFVTPELASSDATRVDHPNGRVHAREDQQRRQVACEGHRFLSGPMGRAAIVNAALKARTERETARRLARLGDTRPALTATPRKRLLGPA